MGIDDGLSMDRHLATLGRCELLSHIRQSFQHRLERLDGLLSLRFDVSDLTIIDLDMRVYIETWIGTLDIHRNGGFNGVQCLGNMALDGEQCYLLFSLVERGQGGHHYLIIEDRIPN